MGADRAGVICLATKVVGIEIRQLNNLDTNVRKKSEGITGAVIGAIIHFAHITEIDQSLCTWSTW